MEVVKGINIENLNAYYGDHHVLHDVSFSMESGKLMCVLGPNGVGKSTMFQCILGLSKKHNGKMEIDGKDIEKMSIKERAKMVSYIPQTHAPVFAYKVRDIVLMSTEASIKGFKSPGKEQIKMAEDAIEKVGIGYLADRKYTQISGGERQLVMIARALAQQAKFIIMDEPTSNLDYGNQIRIMSRVKELTKEGYTIIQSCHQPDQAFLYADEILVLWNGQVLLKGSPKDVLTQKIIHKIYDVDVEIKSLNDDRIRVCIPADICRE